MTDRPITLPAPMVRGLINGRKTQTRQILKPQPYPLKGDHANGMWNASGSVGGRICTSDAELARLHRYAVGDRLWVREEWVVKRLEPFVEQNHFQTMIKYACDAAEIGYECDQQSGRGIYHGLVEVKKRSNHLPRWASRVTLILTGVKIERLQDISEEDAKAEGAFHHRPCQSAVHGTTIAPDSFYFDHTPEGRLYEATMARDAYEIFWGKINGWKSWNANPWVAAISFHIINKNIDAINPV